MFIFSYLKNFSGHCVESKLETILAVYTKFRVVVLFGIQLHIYEFILTKSSDKYKIWKDMH